MFNHVMFYRIVLFIKCLFSYVIISTEVFYWSRVYSVYRVIISTEKMHWSIVYHVIIFTEIFVCQLFIM